MSGTNNIQYNKPAPTQGLRRVIFCPDYEAFFVLVNSSQLGLIAEILVVKVCLWSFPEVKNLELLALQKARIF